MQAAEPIGLIRVIRNIRVRKISSSSCLASEPSGLKYVSSVLSVCDIMKYLVMLSLLKILYVLFLVSVSMLIYISCYADLY